MATHTMLIPLDGSAFSRQILPVVRRMIRPDQYTVALLRVAEEPMAVLAEPPQYVPVDHSLLPLPRSAVDADRVAHPIYQSQSEAAVRAALEDELQSDVYYLQAAGFDVSTIICFGDPAREIVDVVQSRGIDLVAMATHGRTGVQRFVLGSVAENVLRHIAAPVLLIRPVAEAGGGSLV